MSGSGGNGGYEPSPRATFDCATGSITTNVSTIDLAVLEKHKVGDKLNVEVSPIRSLTLVDNNGETLGAIMHVNTTDIIDCIEAGNVYEAEISSIKTPACTVKVRRIV